MSELRVLKALCGIVILLALHLCGLAKAADPKVANGDDHSLFVNPDQTVSSMGQNFFGQLGDGTNAGRSQPSRIAGLSGVSSVAAAGSYSLALKTNGEVWHWGALAVPYGEVPYSPIFEPTKVAGLSDVKFIAAGYYNSLAVKTDGTVLGWGLLFGGATPTIINGLSDIVQVAVGDHHYLALRAGGTVMAAGDNSTGQLGDGTAQASMWPIELPSLSNVKFIGAGSYHSVAIENDGDFWAWGDNYYGQLGDGRVSMLEFSPIGVAYFGDIISLSCASTSTYVVCADGTAWHTGAGAEMYSAVPTLVPGVSNGSAVAAGRSNALIVKSDGTVLNRGVYGYIGAVHPLQLKGVSGVSSPGSGTSTSFVKTDRTMWDYGSDEWAVPLPQFAEVAGFPRAFMVAKGISNRLGLKPDGNVAAMGANGEVQVNLTGVKSISGERALKVDGSVWRLGSSGYLGDGLNGPRLYFTQIPDLADIASMPMGSGLHSHEMAVTKTGKLLAWGQNDSGQLGINSTTNQPIPVQVYNVTDAVDGVVGYLCSMAVDSNGEVWTWGANEQGILGNGTLISRSVPEKIAGFDGIVSVSTGYSHALALKSDGSVWGWGKNTDRLLGDDNMERKLTPVEIPAAFIGPKGKFFPDAEARLMMKEDGTLFSWSNSIDKIYPILVPDPYLNPVVGVNVLTTLPDAVLVSRVSNNTLVMNQTTTVECSVTGGSIASVAFYARGALLGEDTSAPFTTSYQAKSWGDFEITAIVTTGAGHRLSPPVIRLNTPYDSDGDLLPDWKEFKYIGSLAHGLDDDSDGDGFTNRNEIENLHTDPFHPDGGLDDVDGDGLPDQWEIEHFGNIMYRDGTDSYDGDWLTDLEEYQRQLDPDFNDDTDMDGWIDGEESAIVNFNLNDGIRSNSDIFPWTDTDGDGLADALELRNGTDPRSAADPAVITYDPLIKLEPSGFSGSTFYATWNNAAGTMGGQFTAESDNPTLVTKNGVQAVEFKSGFQNSMVGPRAEAWMNGSGSRTVTAWVFNPMASPSEDDVLISWGTHMDSRRQLFSCRYGSSSTKGAFSQSGDGQFDFGWGSAAPVTGTWSFVVYRYDGTHGVLLAMKDFVSGVSERNISLQTGSFDSNSRPGRFILGGETLLNGSRKADSVTDICIGELQVFDRVVPLSVIINSIYEPSKAAYGHGSTSLVDSDSDGIPDVLEAGLGLDPAKADSDEDGVSDSDELAAGADPRDFFNGVSHYAAVTGGNNQTVIQGGRTPSPIEFTVYNYKGEVIPKAPVKISLVPGSTGQLESATGILPSPYETKTDSVNGGVSIFFKSN